MARPCVVIDWPMGGGARAGLGGGAPASKHGLIGFFFEGGESPVLSVAVGMILDWANGRFHDDDQHQEDVIR